MKILFMGTAEFGLPALTRLLDSTHEIVGVVTTPDSRKGRGLKLYPSPVAQFAESKGISPILKPSKLRDKTFIKTIDELNADVFVVIAYRILPEAVFTLPKIATVNAHASLLPQFRGPAPIHRAIESGVKETGITVFRIDKGVDTGNIITQKVTAIGERDTTLEVYERLSALGADAIAESIDILESGTVEYISQNHDMATHAPKLEKSEGRIMWGDSASNIYNKLRAFKPFPGLYTTLNDKQLGIDWAEPLDNTLKSDKEKCGTIIEIGKDYFDVSCGEGILRVTNVKPAGKKIMDVKSFLNGTKIEKGTILG